MTEKETNQKEQPAITVEEFMLALSVKVNRFMGERE